MRHTDLINIRETKRETHVNLLFVFDDGIQLAAGVSPGLLHTEQKRFNFFANDFDSVPSVVLS